MIKTAIDSKDYIDIVKWDDYDIGKMIKMITVALAQIPISTFSHIWVFVRQYGIMFVIIVIIIIIIIIYRKVKVSTLKHV